MQDERRRMPGRRHDHRGPPTRSRLPPHLREGPDSGHPDSGLGKVVSSLGLARRKLLRGAVCLHRSMFRKEGVVGGRRRV